MASISLLDPKSKREEGENLLIQASFSNYDDEQGIESEFKKIVGEVDHHHLSKDQEFGFLSYEQLLIWLDQRLKKSGRIASEITVHINPNKSLSLKN